MARCLALLTILVSGALAYLSLLDRRSALALELVELDGRSGIPLFAIAGIIGIALLLTSALMGPRKVHARNTRTASRTSANPLEAGGEDFRERVVQAAAAVQVEPGCRIEIDALPGVPLTLVFEDWSSKRRLPSVRVALWGPSASSWPASPPPTAPACALFAAPKRARRGTTR